MGIVLVELASGWYVTGNEAELLFEFSENKLSFYRAALYATRSWRP